MNRQPISTKTRGRHPNTAYSSPKQHRRQPIDVAGYDLYDPALLALSNEYRTGLGPGGDSPRNNGRPFSWLLHPINPVLLLTLFLAIPVVWSALTKNPLPAPFNQFSTLLFIMIVVLVITGLSFLLLKVWNYHANQQTWREAVKAVYIRNHQTRLPLNDDTNKRVDAMSTTTTPTSTARERDKPPANPTTSAEAPTTAPRAYPSDKDPLAGVEFFLINRNGAEGTADPTKTTTLDVALNPEVLSELQATEQVKLLGLKEVERRFNGYGNHL